MRALIVGLGNDGRGDDAAGRIAARRLRGVLGVDVSVMEHPGEPVDLIADWDAFDLVVLIDAERGPPAGTIRRFEHGVDRLPPRGLGTSSHAFDLAVAIALAASLDRLPPRLVLYAVAGREFGFGALASPEVERAAERVADLVAAELGHMALPSRTRSAAQAPSGNLT